MMTLKDILAAFLTFREEVIRRRTIYLLGKARERAHVLIGLAVAVASIDEVVAMIRASPDPATARAGLMARAWPAADVAPLIALIEDPGESPGEGAPDGTYRLSEAQARAILDLRLQRLTGLEREKITADLNALAGEIEEHLAILGSRMRLLEVLRTELIAIRDQFATPRRTAIEEEEPDADIEDLIQREDMVVTVTNTGYIKRVPLSTYRAQRRGGKGRAGMSIRDEDFVSQNRVVNTHTPVLFFSSTGIVYKLKVYRLPLGTPTARGKAMVNILPLQPGETITTMMPLPEDETTWQDLFVGFATASGRVRRNALSDFTNIMASGKIAMKLAPGDRLVRVRTFSETDDIVLFTRRGQCIRFSVADVRVFVGRTSTGVRGVRLAAGDEVISMCALRHFEVDAQQREEYLQAVNARRRLAGGDYAERPDDRIRDAELAARLDRLDAAEMAANEEFLLTVAEDGFGKRSSSFEYRITGRDGQGIAAIDLARIGGSVTTVGAFPVLPTDQIVMITDRGQIIRCPVNGIGITGRRTRGVRLFATADGERVVSVTRIREEVEVVDGEGNGEGEDPDAAGNGGADDAGNRRKRQRLGLRRGDHEAGGRRRPAPAIGRERTGSMDNGRIGVYPGTFDPVTNGHVDIISRSTRIVEHLVIGVAVNAGKGPLFSLEERVEMLEEEVSRMRNGDGTQDRRAPVLQPAHALRRGGRGDDDPARAARGLGLRVRVSDGGDEHPAQRPGRDRLPDGVGEPPVHRLALCQGSGPARRRHRLVCSGVGQGPHLAPSVRSRCVGPKLGLTARRGHL